MHRAIFHLVLTLLLATMISGIIAAPLPATFHELSHPPMLKLTSLNKASQLKRFSGFDNVNLANLRFGIPLQFGLSNPFGPKPPPPSEPAPAASTATASPFAAIQQVASSIINGL